MTKLWENYLTKMCIRDRYYTRTSDTNPTLDQRVQLANKANADLFISVHNNSDATGNFTKVKGCLLYTSKEQWRDKKRECRNE